MPSTKSGFQAPFPYVSPAFLRQLERLRRDERVKCARMTESLRRMIDDLDVLERHAQDPQLKAMYGQLLDSLNLAYQSSGALCRDLAARER